jgi:hypothetical protein
MCHSAERGKGELEQISWRMSQPAETGSAYPRSPPVPEDTRGTQCRVGMILISPKQTEYWPITIANKQP